MKCDHFLNLKICFALDLLIDNFNRNAKNHNISNLNFNSGFFGIYIANKKLSQFSSKQIFVNPKTLNEPLSPNDFLAWIWLKNNKFLPSNLNLDSYVNEFTSHESLLMRPIDLVSGLSQYSEYLKLLHNDKRNEVLNFILGIFENSIFHNMKFDLLPMYDELESYKNYRKKYPHSKHISDLRAAHGTCGILLFLMWQYNSDLFDEKTKDRIKNLIERVVPIYIESHRIPIFVIDQKNIDYEFHGWCYGKIAIAHMLLLHAKLFNSKKSLEISTCLIKAEFKKISQIAFSDLGLCHGLSGICLTFFSIYQITKNSQDFDNFNFITLKLCDQILRFENDNIYSKYGMMDSPIGALNLLLDIYLDKCPSWSSFLLLSDPYENL